MFDAQRLKRLGPNALLFVLVAAVLLVMQWITNAHKPLQELGDFAANSLLILDAKRLHLLYGNYSRIGVHHPGPAILYVLAAGEAVFHDLLRIAPSAFSGQLLAVCLYSAGWIVTIFAIMRRSLGALLPALLFTAVFTAALGCFEPSVFLGIWFPDLYMLPFAVMLAAVARLAYGHTDSLRALAVSSGFVINGHVSFIPMLGVVLIVMLAANLLITRRERERRILSPAFLLRHRRELLTASGILLLFFVPLLILTVTEFPGPLYDYVMFGGIDKHNSLAEAIKFVGVYWGGGTGIVWGLLLLVLTVKGVRGPSAQFSRAARSVGVACIAATLALLVYAKFGIDHLDFVYVGQFYYTAPALTTALVALYIFQAMRTNARLLFAGVALVWALSLSWTALNESVYYDEVYDIPGSAELYRQLIALPGTGRIVMDVEMKGADWDKVWGNVAALELYARRQGQDLICINENWHLLFTVAGRCRPEELNNPRHYYARYMNAPDQQRGDADFEGQGLLLYRHGRVDTPGAYTMPGEQRALFRTMLGKGWGDLDGNFVWSLGPEAELTLPADPRRGSAMRLDVGYYRWDHKARQQLEVVINGKSAGHWEFNPIEERRQLRVELGDDPGAAQHIVFKIAHPMSPKQAGRSEDTRQFGIALHGYR